MFRAFLLLGFWDREIAEITTRALPLSTMADFKEYFRSYPSYLLPTMGQQVCIEELWKPKVLTASVLSNPHLHFSQNQNAGSFSLCKRSMT